MEMLFPLNLQSFFHFTLVSVRNHHWIVLVLPDHKRGRRRALGDSYRAQLICAQKVYLDVNLRRKVVHCGESFCEMINLFWWVRECRKCTGIMVILQKINPDFYARCQQNSLSNIFGIIKELNLQVSPKKLKSKARSNIVFLNMNNILETVCSSSI